MVRTFGEVPRPFMKPALFFLPLVLVACASKEAVVEEPAPAPTPSEEITPAVVDEAPQEPLPAPGEDLGLLEPEELTAMPEDRDMRPTVNPGEANPIIATPPAGR